MGSSEIKIFYDDLYSSNPKVFGDTTHDFLKTVFTFLPISKGRALDIGAGEGLSSCYLAERGYVVDALDISTKAFSGVPKNESGITLHYGDICNFQIDTSYAIILCSFVFHHLTKKEFSQLIARLKENTVGEGVHAFRLFTMQSAFARNDKEKEYFFDDGNMLNALYSDWVIVFDEKELINSAVGDMQNEVRSVIFQKK
jgi:2-polyprenyl-3-methyl-5-hydroxy-6-metoxy-1,4-benzoquinol methylase